MKSIFEQLYKDELKLAVHLHGFAILPTVNYAGLLKLRAANYSQASFSKKCLRGSSRPYSLADLQAYSAMIKSKQRRAK